MKIEIISDTHGHHRKVHTSSGDVLIHAGDFMVSGLNELEIVDFNNWLGEQDFRYKIVIAGNHDVLFERFSAVKTLLTNAIYLEDSGAEIDGIKFWGSPYTPRFFNWAFNEDRGQSLSRHWDIIPDDTDVLITHGPPLNILDYSHYGNENVGCRDLMLAVQRVQPALHIFGHIHGSYGRHTAGPTLFLNASVCNEAYLPANAPWSLQFNCQALAQP